MIKFIKLFSICEPQAENLEKLSATQAKFIEDYSNKVDSSNVQYFIYDKASIHIGTGIKVFEDAVKAVYELKMFNIEEYCRAIAFDPILKKGSIVVVKAKAMKIWVKLVSCITEEIKDDSLEELKQGFAYTTLDAHLEFGREWFIIRYDKKTEQVYFDLSSISRPHGYAYLIFPIIRYYQRYFQKKLLHALKKSVI